MAVPEEEVRKQAAAGEEGPVSYRGFDPLIQYLLHRLDAMKASLRAEITGLRSEITALRQDVRDEIGGLRKDISQVHEETHRLEVSMEREFRKLAWWAVGIIVTVVVSALVPRLF
ncbi:MAG: hypothetical protein H5U01_18150 [Clostridia bacterium]|nr:hypothetical protein [Clostridia bacterium]